MNKVELIGRWTRDVELSTLKNSDQVVAKGSLAVDSKRKGSDGNYLADFIPVVAWGKTAELIANSISGKKGHLIGLTGHLQSGKYTDDKYKNKEGKAVTHYTLDFIVEEITFIEKKDSTTNAGYNPPAGTNEGDIMTPVDDGDIPF